MKKIILLILILLLVSCSSKNSVEPFTQGEADSTVHENQVSLESEAEDITSDNGGTEPTYQVVVDNDEFDDEFIDELDEFDEEFLDELDEEDGDQKLVADPLYYWNYAMFQFNDKLYFWVLKPVTKGYRFVFPELVRTGVKNFFVNITTPVRFVSCALQGKVKGAGTELGRFLMNSTVGVLGIWDPAKKYFDMEATDEDMGQVLGKYGIGNGIYIVWPFLGSSTLRDSIGLVGDTYLNPISYVDPTEVSVAIKAEDKVNTISFHPDAYERIKDAALDPYAAFRDAYIQYRQKKVLE